MTSTVVVGGFFGDEGKGKIISYLAIKDDPKVIVRGGAGPNAGHTIREGDKVYKVRMLPSGFLNKNAKVMIGPGVVINPEVLLKEIDDFGASGRAFIDNHCGIIEDISEHPQKLIAFNLEGILEIYLNLDNEKKEIISQSVKKIINNFENEKKRKLLLIIPDNAQKYLNL